MTNDGPKKRAANVAGEVEPPDKPGAAKRIGASSPAVQRQTPNRLSLHVAPAPYRDASRLAAPSSSLQQPIRWAAWLATPNVKVWQAVALVVDINPHSLRISDEAWTVGPTPSPMFARSSFPSHDKRRAYEEALAHAELAVAGERLHLLENSSGPFVALREVVEYFVACEWPNMPTPLLDAFAPGLGAPAQPAPAAKPVPAVADDARLQWWRTAYDILEMAQNIGAKLHADSKRTSKVEIAKEIERRINAIERGKGRDRVAPDWDTIRGYLPQWRKAPD